MLTCCVKMFKLQSKVYQKVLCIYDPREQLLKLFHLSVHPYKTTQEWIKQFWLFCIGEFTSSFQSDNFMISLHMSINTFWDYLVMQRNVLVSNTARNFTVNVLRIYWCCITNSNILTFCFKYETKSSGFWHSK